MKRNGRTRMENGAIESPVERAVLAKITMEELRKEGKTRVESMLAEAKEKDGTMGRMMNGVLGVERTVIGNQMAEVRWLAAKAGVPMGQTLSILNRWGVSIG